VNSSNMRPLMSFAEAAKYLCVSTRQVYRLLEEGRIPVVKVGLRSPRIRPEDLEKYLDSKTSLRGRASQ